MYLDDNGYNARITRLETRIAQMELEQTSTSTRDVKMMEQAAVAQATQHLYAPLRNDTRAVIELAAFVRSIAAGACNLLRVREEAQKLLERLQK